MIDKGMKVCDFDRIVVDDGKTILPGYVEVNKNDVVKFISEDSNNNIAQVGVLRNRHQDDRGNDLIVKTIIGKGYGDTDDTVRHFCNIDCYAKWNLRLSKLN